MLHTRQRPVLSVSSLPAAIVAVTGSKSKVEMKPVVYLVSTRTMSRSRSRYPLVLAVASRHYSLSLVPSRSPSPSSESPLPSCRDSSSGLQVPDRRHRTTNTGWAPSRVVPTGVARRGRYCAGFESSAVCAQERVVVATILKTPPVPNDAFSFGRCSPSCSSIRLGSMDWHTCRTSDKFVLGGTSPPWSCMRDSSPSSTNAVGVATCYHGVLASNNRPSRCLLVAVRDNTSISIRT
jgi:hypothetical protein